MSCTENRTGGRKQMDFDVYSWSLLVVYPFRRVKHLRSSFGIDGRTDITLGQMISKAKTIST